tara:strand:+ start:1863 stop:3323 length:1461 start_codon:yes stop_codon:yes gene_type:complete
MNLVALRQKVKNITDYSPELQQFNDQLDELLNDAYYKVWTTKRWSFATKIAFLDFQPDISESTDTEYSLGVPITAAVIQGERKVTFSNSIGRLENVDIWEGSPISLNDNEYIISRIDSKTEILLTESFQGVSATVTNWKIKKRTYKLPEDCAELLYLGHRDYPYNNNAGNSSLYGKATAILPRQEEVINLRADYAANYAEAYIPSPTIPIQSAEKIAFESAAGSISTGYYEFCWAFEKEGKLSPLSKSATHYLSSTGGIIIKFMSFDNKTLASDSYQSNDQVAPQWEGYRKKIFWNKNFDPATGERTGLPCWLAVTVGGSTRNAADYLNPSVAADVAINITINNNNQLDNGSKRYIEIDGTHQEIRPYPRVNGFDEKIATTDKETVYIKQAVMRYYKKPKDMLLATDSPEMPFEFHQLIVYKALEDIYLKLGQQGLATTYDQKYQKEIKQLQKRYVDKIDFLVRRGQFGSRTSGTWFDAQSLRYSS